MKTGTIVTLDDLNFENGENDTKKSRPCIFLFEKSIDEKEYAYIMPLTSNVKRFNKDCDRYAFIPQTIYNQRKLSFAKIDGIICVPSEQLISCEMILSDNIVMQLLNKIRSYAQQRQSTTNVEDTIEEFKNKTYYKK